MTHLVLRRVPIQERRFSACRFVYCRENTLFVEKGTPHNQVCHPLDVWNGRWHHTKECTLVFIPRVISCFCDLYCHNGLITWYWGSFAAHCWTGRWVIQRSGSDLRSQRGPAGLWISWKIHWTEIRMSETEKGLPASRTFGISAQFASRCRALQRDQQSKIAAQRS